jgi:hypothetical protein
MTISEIQQTHSNYQISLEAFMTTEFNEIFLGRQPHRDVKVFQHFGNFQQTHGNDQISLEAFSATEFNEIFLGRQPGQDVKAFQHFGN